MFALKYFYCRKALKVNKTFPTIHRNCTTMGNERWKGVEGESKPLYILLWMLNSNLKEIIDFRWKRDDVNFKYKRKCLNVRRKRISFVIRISAADPWILNEKSYSVIRDYIKINEEYGIIILAVMGYFFF